MRSNAMMMVESGMREIVGRVVGRGNKRGMTPAEVSAYDAWRRAGAGCSSLLGWAEMSDEDMARDDSKALAAAALAMVEDPAVKAMALSDLAMSCLGVDKPNGWLWAKSVGLGPMAERISLRAEWSWSVGSQPLDDSPWLGAAIARRAWRCAEMFANRPDEVEGLPGFKKKDAPIAGEANQKKKPKASRKAAKALAGLSEEDWAIMDGLSQGANRWGALWRTARDPMLAAWEGELAGYDNGTMPARVQKAIFAAGYALEWGDEGFDLAAAGLALRGSEPALAACLAAGKGPAKALAEGMSRGEEESEEEFPPLAMSGGVLKSVPEEVAAWGAISQWIDADMGEGTAKGLEECAAFRLAGFCVSRGTSGDERGAKGLAWLLSNGPVATDAASLAKRVQELQGWVIEAEEGSRGKASKSVEELRACLETWESALAGPGAPKRKLLKA